MTRGGRGGGGGERPEWDLAGPRRGGAAEQAEFEATCRREAVDISRERKMLQMMKGRDRRESPAAAAAATPSRGTPASPQKRTAPSPAPSVKTPTPAAAKFDTPLWRDRLAGMPETMYIQGDACAGEYRIDPARMAHGYPVWVRTAGGYMMHSNAEGRWAVSPEEHGNPAAGTGGSPLRGSPVARVPVPSPETLVEQKWVAAGGVGASGGAGYYVRAGGSPSRHRTPPSASLRPRGGPREAPSLLEVYHTLSTPPPRGGYAPRGGGGAAAAVYDDGTSASPPLTVSEPTEHSDATPMPSASPVPGAAHAGGGGGAPFSHYAFRMGREANAFPHLARRTGGGGEGPHVAALPGVSKGLQVLSPPPPPPQPQPQGKSTPPSRASTTARARASPRPSRGRKGAVGRRAMSASASARSNVPSSVTGGDDAAHAHTPVPSAAPQSQPPSAAKAATDAFAGRSLHLLQEAYPHLMARARRGQAPDSRYPVRFGETYIEPENAYDDAGPDMCPPRTLWRQMIEANDYLLDETAAETTQERKAFLPSTALEVFNAVAEHELQMKAEGRTLLDSFEEAHGAELAALREFAEEPAVASVSTAAVRDGATTAPYVPPGVGEGIVASARERAEVDAEPEPEEYGQDATITAGPRGTPNRMHTHARTQRATPRGGYHGIPRGVDPEGVALGHEHDEDYDDDYDPDRAAVVGYDERDVGYSPQELNGSRVGRAAAVDYSRGRAVTLTAGSDGRIRGGYVAAAGPPAPLAVREVQDYTAQEAARERRVSPMRSGAGVPRVPHPSVRGIPHAHDPSTPSSTPVAPLNYPYYSQGSAPGSVQRGAGARTQDSSVPGSTFTDVDAETEARVRKATARAAASPRAGSGVGAGRAGARTPQSQRAGGERLSPPVSARGRQQQQQRGGGEVGKDNKAKADTTSETPSNPRSRPRPATASGRLSPPVSHRSTDTRTSSAGRTQPRRAPGAGPGCPDVQLEGPGSVAARSSRGPAGRPPSTPDPSVGRSRAGPQGAPAGSGVPSPRDSLRESQGDEGGSGFGDGDGGDHGMSFRSTGAVGHAVGPGAVAPSPAGPERSAASQRAICAVVPLDRASLQHTTSDASPQLMPRRDPSASGRSVQQPSVAQSQPYIPPQHSVGPSPYLATPDDVPGDTADARVPSRPENLNFPTTPSQSVGGCYYRQAGRIESYQTDPFLSVASDSIPRLPFDRLAGRSSDAGSTACDAAPHTGGDSQVSAPPHAPPPTQHGDTRGRGEGTPVDRDPQASAPAPSARTCSEQASAGEFVEGADVTLAQVPSALGGDGKPTPPRRDTSTVAPPVDSGIALRERQHTAASTALPAPPPGTPCATTTPTSVGREGMARMLAGEEGRAAVYEVAGEREGRSPDIMSSPRAGFYSGRARLHQGGGSEGPAAAAATSTPTPPSQGREQESLTESDREFIASLWSPPARLDEVGLPPTSPRRGLVQRPSLASAATPRQHSSRCRSTEPSRKDREGRDPPGAGRIAALSRTASPAATPPGSARRMSTTGPLSPLSEGRVKRSRSISEQLAHHNMLSVHSGGCDSPRRRESVPAGRFPSGTHAALKSGELPSNPQSGAISIPLTHSVHASSPSHGWRDGGAGGAADLEDTTGTASRDTSGGSPRRRASGMVDDAVDAMFLPASAEARGEGSGPEGAVGTSREVLDGAPVVASPPARASAGAAGAGEMREDMTPLECLAYEDLKDVLLDEVTGALSSPRSPRASARSLIASPPREPPSPPPPPPPPPIAVAASPHHGRPPSAHASDWGGAVSPPPSTTPHWSTGAVGASLTVSSAPPFMPDAITVLGSPYVKLTESYNGYPIWVSLAHATHGGVVFCSDNGGHWIAAPESTLMDDFTVKINGNDTVFLSHVESHHKGSPPTDPHAPWSRRVTTAMGPVWTAEDTTVVAPADTDDDDAGDAAKSPTTKPPAPAPPACCCCVAVPAVGGRDRARLHGVLRDYAEMIAGLYQAQGGVPRSAKGSEASTPTEPSLEGDEAATPWVEAHQSNTSHNTQLLPARAGAGAHSPEGPRVPPPVPAVTAKSVLARLVRECHGTTPGLWRIPAALARLATAPTAEALQTIEKAGGVAQAMLLSILPALPPSAPHPAGVDATAPAAAAVPGEFYVLLEDPIRSDDGGGPARHRFTDHPAGRPGGGGGAAGGGGGYGTLSHHGASLWSQGKVGAAAPKHHLLPKRFLLLPAPTVGVRSLERYTERVGAQVLQGAVVVKVTSTWYHPIPNTDPGAVVLPPGLLHLQDVNLLRSPCPVTATLVDPIFEFYPPPTRRALLAAVSGTADATTPRSPGGTASAAAPREAERGGPHIYAFELPDSSRDYDNDARDARNAVATRQLAHLREAVRGHPPTAPRAVVFYTSAAAWVAAGGAAVDQLHTPADIPRPEGITPERDALGALQLAFAHIRKHAWHRPTTTSTTPPTTRIVFMTLAGGRDTPAAVRGALLSAAAPRLGRRTPHVISVTVYAPAASVDDEEVAVYQRLATLAGGALTHRQA